jgi:hypothetical protein
MKFLFPIIIGYILGIITTLIIWFICVVEVFCSKFNWYNTKKILYILFKED